MSWWSVLDELGWALLFLFGPGLAVGAALGLRRVWLFAAAPAVSIAVLGAGAVLLELVGMPWGRLGALVVTVVVLVCVLGLRRLLGRRWPTDAPPRPRRCGPSWVSSCPHLSRRSPSSAAWSTRGCPRRPGTRPST